MTSTRCLDSTGPVPVGLLRAAVDDLQATDPDAIEVGALGVALADTHREIERLRGLTTAWTASFARRDGHKASGARDTQAFLQKQLHQSPNEARRQTQAARDLAALPGTSQALAAGAITFEQAATIGQTVRELGRLTDAEACARAEAHLLARSRSGHGGEVRRSARQLLQAADRDAADRDAATAFRQRGLTLTDDRHGNTYIEGRTTSAVGARLRALLDQYNQATGPDDDRTPAQRNADALEAICQTTSQPHAARQPGLPGLDNDRLGGVIAVATIDAVTSGEGGGLLRGREPIPASVLQGLICEYGLSLLITDPNGLPLWLGAMVRFATDAQRAALTVRDGGCRWPGCTMPPDRCLAHHVDFGPDGPGPTDVHRLALLCGVHHNFIHHAGWTLELDDHAMVTTTSPTGATAGTITGTITGTIRTETARQARLRHTGTDLPGPRSGERSCDPPRSSPEIAGESPGIYRPGRAPPATTRPRAGPRSREGPNQRAPTHSRT